MTQTKDEAAEAHQRLLDSVAERFNKATPVERKKMQHGLVLTKGKAMSSVRGLKTIFPALRKPLSVTEEGKKS